MRYDPPVVDNPYQVDTTKADSKKGDAFDFSEAVIYARTSPRPQPTEGSLQKQIDACKERAREKRLEVVGTFTDDKKSGKEIRGRDGLQDAMRLASERRAVILAYDLSRVSRSLTESFRIVEELDKGGSALMTVSGPQVDTTSPLSKTIFGFAVLINQYFREQSGQLTKESLDWRRQQGMVTGTVPYGWYKDKNGRAQPHAQQQRLIRWCIWRAENGCTPGWCAGELTARGYTRMDGGKITRQWAATCNERHRKQFGVVRIELDWYDCLVNYLFEKGECWPTTNWLKKPPILFHRGLVPNANGDWPHQHAANDVPAMDTKGRICLPLKDIRSLTEMLHKVGECKKNSEEWEAAMRLICLPKTENEVPELLRRGFEWRPQRFAVPT